MNISKLRTFVTLTECLNFTEAAERLYCSQPSVSMQIQSIEEDLGVPLFDRIGKKLYLTKQGECFKPYAEQMINLLHASRDHIKQLEDLSFGTLAFGASNFVGVYVVPAILRNYTKAFPDIRINMNITSSNHLIQMLESNKVEFLIISDRVVIDETRFERTTFYEDELVLVVPPTHPIAAKKDCNLEDLVNETFIIKPDKSATRTYLENQFAAHGFNPPKYLEISNLEGIKQGVIHELGISIITSFAIKQEVANGLLIKIPIRGVQFNRGVSYVYHRNKHLSPAAKQFLSHLHESVEKL
ncbi:MULTISPECIES: LysR family transcriptional regulator [unclassified Paenibacillus]|uniref:LysR family transcriptional regulator n=1 Tax=unclassified Paenibacillus TaxID=185978 RepID=UPI002F41C2CE